MLLFLSITQLQHGFIRFIRFSLSKTSAIMLKVVKLIVTPWNSSVASAVREPGFVWFSTWATSLSSGMGLVELVCFLVWVYCTKICIAVVLFSAGGLEKFRADSLISVMHISEEKWIANERCFKMKLIKVLLIFWVMFACGRNIAYAWAYDFTVTVSLIL